jgi:F0F1-type ATP synthase alpha subunit
MSQGNVIVFKGERNTGKSTVAANTIEMFLEENSNNRAIYVGLGKKTSSSVHKSISPEN